MITDMDSLRSAISTAGSPLLLFSGGLDGAYLLATLQCRDLVALTVDLGGDSQIELARHVCTKLGVRHLVVDAKSRFVNECVLPSIRAHATYAGGHPICASLSRPLLAQVAIETAAAEGCSVIVHTSHPSQNSLRRFNGALRDCPLRYRGMYGSPFAKHGVQREVKCRTLVKAGLSEYAQRPISKDTSLWGREFECGQLDDPERIQIAEDLFHWTHRQKRIPGPESVEISFFRGNPVSLNGERQGPLEIIEALNGIVGRFGLGRYVGLEEIEGGAKVQEVREMPAAHILFDAFRRLESACVPYDCIRQKLSVEQSWVREAVEGRWFGPLRVACGMFIDSVAHRVSGKVVYRLSENRLEIAGVMADEPMYVRDRQQLE